MSGDSTQRFTDRVEDYVRFRPGYPAALPAFLKDELGLRPEWKIADLGSGTGILTRLLLERGNAVVGVEPNAAMRGAAERLLAGFARFESASGTAERTTLADHSVELVTAAQAFHWFDPVPARAELQRILKPGPDAGWVALIWNDRVDGTPLADGYEDALLKYGTDYREVSTRYRHPPGFNDELAAFYGTVPRKNAVFPNRQVLDLESLLGRVASASYAPPPGHPNHEPMRQALTELFERHQSGGRVTIEYETRVYCGQLGSAGTQPPLGPLRPRR